MGFEDRLAMPLEVVDKLDEAIGDKMNLWENFTDQLWDSLTDTSMWLSVMEVVSRILLIVIASRIAKAILFRIIDHLMNSRSSKRFKLRSRRVQTVGKLFKNATTYALNFIVILLILGEFHIQLAPLLAGAGVIGLAVGFGAQSLVKDVITGFFIILEDHFSVGDVIETGKFRGTVEMIGLRATRIKSWTGEVFIVPNGVIADVTNYSVNDALAVVDFSVAATERLEEATDVVKDVLARFEDPNLISSPELIGVQTVTAADVLLRVTALCRPNTQTAVTRHLNEELKKAFEQAGNPRYYKPAERVGGVG